MPTYRPANFHTFLRHTPMVINTKVHFMMAEKIFACKFEIFCWKITKRTFLFESFLCMCIKSGNFYSHGKWCCGSILFHHLFMVTEFFFTFLYDLQCEKRKELFAKFILMLKSLFSGWYAYDYMTLNLYVQIYIWDYYKLWWN